MMCQCGYDAGAGDSLVSMYHIAKLSDEGIAKSDRLEEVRIKVFLPRTDSPLSIGLLDLENCGLAGARNLRYVWHHLRRTS